MPGTELLPSWLNQLTRDRPFKQLAACVCAKSEQTCLSDAPLTRSCKPCLGPLTGFEVQAQLERSLLSSWAGTDCGNHILTISDASWTPTFADASMLDRLDLASVGLSSFVGCALAEG